MYQDPDTYYLACDPGSSNGGWVYKAGTTTICGKNSEIEQLTINKKTVVIIERVPTYVGPIPASSSFKLGYSYGYLVGKFSHYKTHLVTPQVWQAYLNIGKKSDHKNWKARLKDEAIKLFPDQRRITLATADAYLLLHYALKNKLS
jgi:hypothetical protein